MTISRRERPLNVITIKYLSLQKICSLKYLEVDIKSQADSFEKIHKRITEGNKFFFSLVQLFKSKKLSWRTKIKLYIRPLLTFSILCIWSMSIY